MMRELAGQAWRAWVALDGHRVIGQVWVNLIHKVPNPVGERDRHAYLSNLYVQPTARGGVGTALLETVLDWAGHQGVDRIVLWPSGRSVSLYRRYQFRRDAEVMELTRAGLRGPTWRCRAECPRLQRPALLDPSVAA